MNDILFCINFDYKGSNLKFCMNMKKDIDEQIILFCNKYLLNSNIFSFVKTQVYLKFKKRKIKRS